MNNHSCSRFLLVALATLALASAGAGRAHAEAKLLLEASTGKVLLAENATYPWYPASVTKLMTTYTTLREVQQRKISLNTLITMTHNATAQEPSKMGLPVGTRLTIDNALKMLLVKSANDVAVAIAEGVGGSLPKFADLMNANAARLGMTQSHFVNPNGLPAEHHVTSARDLGILARALIREFPQYDYFWHIHSIRFGNRIIHNYNRLLDRYPGADGMKTGFICASGFNLVASATRNGRRLIVGRARRPFRKCPQPGSGQAPGARLRLDAAVVADALARHRRRADAGRRETARSARRNVRSASQAPQSAVRQ